VFSRTRIGLDEVSCLLDGFAERPFTFFVVWLFACSLPASKSSSCEQQFQASCHVDGEASINRIAFQLIFTDSSTRAWTVTVLGCRWCFQNDNWLLLSSSYKMSDMFPTNSRAANRRQYALASATGRERPYELLGDVRQKVGSLRPFWPFCVLSQGQLLQI